MSGPEFSRARDGTQQWFTVRLQPLVDDANTMIGLHVAFPDVTRIKELEAELKQSRAELEAAYESLQSTNEELETTNEELQSAVEELETTNEELQSTNEELETMNEELQSTNEELETVNKETRSDTNDLNRVNGFLRTILSGLHVGAIVLGPEFEVQFWNEESEDLWGMREHEVIGKHFLNLDIGFPVHEFRTQIRDALADPKSLSETTIEATNRRGKLVHLHVRILPVPAQSSRSSVAILVEEQPEPENSAK